MATAAAVTVIEAAVITTATVKLEACNRKNKNKVLVTAVVAKVVATVVPAPIAACGYTAPCKLTAVEAVTTH